MWDGNEVWLVLGGGVLFAVFPLAYASLFSGFYLAFMLVLLVMILRTVALEFRSKEAGQPLAVDLGRGLLRRRRSGSRCCSAWPSATSWAACRSMPSGNISTSLIALLTPFALLVGVTTVAMFAMHGGIYLLMKTEGELHERIDRAVPRLMVAFFVLNTLVVVAMVAVPAGHHRPLPATTSGRSIFPAAALVALGAAWLMVRRGAGLPRLPVLVGDDRAAAHLGRHRALPEPHHLDHRSAPTT